MAVLNSETRIYLPEGTVTNGIRVNSAPSSFNKLICFQFTAKYE